MSGNYSLYFAQLKVRGPVAKKEGGTAVSEAGDGFSLRASKGGPGTVRRKMLDQKSW